MDRGVLGALTVVMRVAVLCVGSLLAVGCVLNPQGEDPGFEDRGAVVNGAEPEGDLAVTPAAPNAGGPIAAGVEPSSVGLPTSPAGPSPGAASPEATMGSPEVETPSEP